MARRFAPVSKIERSERVPARDVAPSTSVGQLLQLGQGGTQGAERLDGRRELADFDALLGKCFHNEALKGNAERPFQELVIFENHVAEQEQLGERPSRATMCSLELGSQGIDLVAGSWHRHSLPQLSLSGSPTRNKPQGDGYGVDTALRAPKSVHCGSRYFPQSQSGARIVCMTADGQQRSTRYIRAERSSGMNPDNPSEPSFSEWQRLTDAYAAAIHAMEAGQPGASERASRLCARLVRLLRHVDVIPAPSPVIEASPRASQQTPPT